ncbi:hypothetical protein ACSNN7_08530 [Micromonospora sp. URMC 105]|uniref:hypothetical protein n=1 Tax=Micromonospora sp. URMC 105 TaxID=3423413 RepID=UPI003F1A96AD
MPWADEVWDDLVGHLTDADNHNRATAAQLLGNLAAQEMACGAAAGHLLAVTVP